MPIPNNEIALLESFADVLSRMNKYEGHKAEADRISGLMFTELTNYSEAHAFAFARAYEQASERNSGRDFGTLARTWNKACDEADRWQPTDPENPGDIKLADDLNKRGA